MSLKGPKTHNLKSIWQAYVMKLRAKPEWFQSKSKRSLKMQNYTVCCKYIDELGKPRIMTYDYGVFKDAMELFFTLAKEAIIDGEALDFGHGIGKIAVRRVERNHARKMVNFYKTKLQPHVWNEEKQKMMRAKIIYFTGNDYCRIGWHKQGKLTNETVYEFLPTSETASGIGFKQMMTTALNANPNQKYKYIYFPLKRKAKAK